MVDKEVLQDFKGFEPFSLDHDVLTDVLRQVCCVLSLMKLELADFFVGLRVFGMFLVDFGSNLQEIFWENIVPHVHHWRVSLFVSELCEDIVHEDELVGVDKLSDD